MLCQQQLQQLPFAEIASLLSSCLLECPDRQHAIRLGKLIRLTITPSIEAASAIQQAQAPGQYKHHSQDMPNWDLASSSREGSHSDSKLLHQEDKTKAYALVSALAAAGPHMAEEVPFLLPCLACSKGGLPFADNLNHDCLNHDKSCLVLGERPLLQPDKGARECYTVPLVMPDDPTNNSISCNNPGKHDIHASMLQIHVLRMRGKVNGNEGFVLDHDQQPVQACVLHVLHLDPVWY